MQKITINHKTYRWFFWAYTFLIILLCVLPINGSESDFNNNYFINIRFDYIAHFILFFPWMFLLRKFSKLSFQISIRSTILLIFVGLLFAFGSELIQYFLSYRAFNINDFFANSIGVILGIIVFIK